MSNFAEDTNVPTNDYISRQAAIDALNFSAELLRRVLDDADVVGVERAKYEWGLGLIESHIFDMKELPSVEPEPRWIPVSERLPEGDGMELKLVTYIDPREGPCVWLGWYEMEDVWYIDGEAHSKELGNEVMAWLNIPGAYEEAEQ